MLKHLKQPARHALAMEEVSVTTVSSITDGVKPVADWSDTAKWIGPQKSDVESLPPECIALEGIGTVLSHLKELFSRKKVIEPNGQMNRDLQSALRSSKIGLEEYLTRVYRTDLSSYKFKEGTFNVENGASVLTIDGKTDKVDLLEIRRYIANVEDWLKDSMSPLKSFYGRVAEIIRVFWLNNDDAAYAFAKQQLERMPHPFDRILASAPKSKRHVGGVNFFIDHDENWWEGDRYSGEVSSTGKGELPLLTLEQFKTAGDLMFKMSEMLYGARNTSVFDLYLWGRFHTNIELHDDDSDDLHKDIDKEEFNQKSNPIYAYEQEIQKKHPMEYTAVVMPYAESIMQLMRALDKWAMASVDRSNTAASQK